MALRLSSPIFRLEAPPRGLTLLQNRKARILLSQGLSSQRREFDSKPNSLCVRAAVVPATTLLTSENEEQNTFNSPNNNNEEEKRKMCEMYGFTQIGDPVPDNVTLKDIMDALPKKVFEIDDTKAWKSVLISVSSYALGLFLISKAPWYLLPLAWAWTGTAVTGFFVIGHDCAHKSFSKNKLLEDIVGTLAFLPLIYPYEPWRFKHDRHHAKTNMDQIYKHLVRSGYLDDKVRIQTLHAETRTPDMHIKSWVFFWDNSWLADSTRIWLSEDTAWHPVWEEEFGSSTALRKAIVFGYGPFRPWMSIAHWLSWHFNLKKFRPNEIARVKISLACVFAFMAIGWPLIILKMGIVGWFKFWLMPWLGYHFWIHYQYVPAVSVLQLSLFTLLWFGFLVDNCSTGTSVMSTFTMVHHTAPHIPFKNAEEWNAAQAQLGGTVHCNYPRWIEILCHDINVHIPHHVSPRIPSYNLRAAHQSLQQNWGKYLNEANWNWRLMKTIMTICHVYNKDRYYVPFDDIAPQDSQPITFLKKFMPEFA